MGNDQCRRAPVAVLATVDGDVLRCEALVIDPKGTRRARSKAQRLVSQAESLVAAIVAELRGGGADQIIAECRFDDGRAKS